MREASFNRVVDLGPENESSARQNAGILIDKFRQFAKEFFRSIDEIKMTVKRPGKDVCVISVSNEEFIAEFECEIANNIRFLNGKEDKFLSLNISSFCESKDFNDAEEMCKNTKFWSKIIGFIVGIFVAFSIRFTFESIRVIVLPNPYLILGVICSFGFVFAYFGNMIGNLIIRSQRKALPGNKLYQTSLEHWKVFIENIDKILDSRFGEHSINKFSDEAKKNDDREIDLVDFDFGTSELEKYETAGNYNKLFEILKNYAENNDEKAFLIIENKSTGNFLQFAKGEKTNFLLDIPMIGLNETERIRAQRFLRKITEKENGENVFDINRGFPAEENGMFIMLLPDNSDLAVKIIIGFFVEVYLLPPNFKFKISKGSF